MATRLVKVSFHASPKEGQCQRMFKLPYSCTHFTCRQGYVQNPSSQPSAVCEMRTCICTSCVLKRLWNYWSNCQHLLDHGESKGFAMSALLSFHVGILRAWNFHWRLWFWKLSFSVHWCWTESWRQNFGEIEKYSFITLPVKGGHSRLTPSKCVSQLEDYCEKFYSNHSKMARSVPAHSSDGLVVR